MDIMHCSTPFFAVSSRKVSKTHSITERKKLEKIASVSLAKHDPDPLIFIYLFIFFVLSLKLRNSKDLLILKLLGVERLWYFRVLFANTLFLTRFEDWEIRFLSRKFMYMIRVPLQYITENLHGSASW